ncbi:hypothetical protein QFC21_000814 [Naganishia friedmannii]|uniref:Uncharacterized protein n=1 Tax=Naganishia friedmannii TaxID=89922 RepID=A0ACC2W6I9_9TREE|nr:hypothetical protein QFC21_000814 [Naganishia friedmannii]
MSSHSPKEAAWTVFSKQHEPAFPSYYASSGADPLENEPSRPSHADASWDLKTVRDPSSPLTLPRRAGTWETEKTYACPEDTSPRTPGLAPGDRKTPIGGTEASREQSTGAEIFALTTTSKWDNWSSDEEGAKSCGIRLPKTRPKAAPEDRSKRTKFKHRSNSAVNSAGTPEDRVGQVGQIGRKAGRKLSSALGSLMGKKEGAEREGGIDVAL